MKVKDDAATLKKAAPDLLANAQSASADLKKSVEDLCKRIDEFTPQVHAMVERASKPWGGAPQVG
jgi:phage shock protein A